MIIPRLFLFGYDASLSTRISIKQVENLLRIDGDFLVRESSHSPGQYVLSGKHQGKIKHLLLIDPDGIVRRTIHNIAFKLVSFRFMSEHEL